MPTIIDSSQICPYLRLARDPNARCSFPEAAHRCHATSPESTITLEHQAGYCLSQKYTECRLYSVYADAPGHLRAPAHSGAARAALRQARSPLGVALGSGVIILVLLLMIYSGTLFLQPRSGAAQPGPKVIVLAASPTDSDAAQPATPAAHYSQPTPTAAALSGAPDAAPTATAVPDGRIFTLFPEAGDIGWVVSNEERGNHFGDSFLYAGIFEGETYFGAFQFDLSSVPRGAPIHQAFLQLTGLGNDHLGGDGTWFLRLLQTEPGVKWRRQNYQDILNASSLYTLRPFLGTEDLTPHKANIFELDPAQVSFLSQRIAQNEQPTISFRLDGPLTGNNNLFAWDTGYGSESAGNKVKLVLNVGPAPVTPPPYEFVLITSTPTSENIATAAAVILQITADATRFGTATPLPYNAVTPTPFPDYLIITPTPTPGNKATAQAIVSLATAFTLVNGTPTPFPTNVVTASPTATATPTPTYVIVTVTPTPASLVEAATAIARLQQQGPPTPLPSNWVTPVVITVTPTPANGATAEAISFMATAQTLTTGTPTPTPGNVQTATPTPTYVIITSTPTPESLFAAATIIARFKVEGAPTPLPPNWVTPVVVTATPSPANPATVQALAVLATAQTWLLGPPTPIPGNMQTATPTPVFNLIALILSPTPTPIPPPTPAAMPASLVGKIVFLSDREAASPETGVNAYVFDPATGQLGRLTATWPYEVAQVRDAWSADQRFRAFTKNFIRYREVQFGGGSQVVGEDVPAVFWYDYFYQVEEKLTDFGTGIAYGGVWSPASEQIAFVSNETGDDEIWVSTYNGTDIRPLTRNNTAYNAREIGKDTFIPEINKHPSWSPDGAQIIFFSNRTGNNQLWIMDKDGSNQRLLMEQNPYNDWDPVWIKYPDLAPASP